MSNYFDNVKENDEIYGVVFGKGKVKTVWGSDLECYYTFEVEFDNGFTVAYTAQGFPSWGTKNFTTQTIFYKKDIDVMDLDIEPADEILSPKKIIKLRNKKKLEVRCPSGIWMPTDSCPGYITEEYLEEGKYHLFRKMKD